MLAATLKNIEDLKYPILATPKLDGIRCLIVNGKAVTRNFKSQPNNFVRTYLEEFASEGYEGFDGELILKGKEFNEISSAIMSEDGQPNFTYVVFDLYDITGYNNRMNLLACCPERTRIKFLFPILINSEEELIAYEAKCLSDGYEGIILRSPNSPYKFGRSTIKEGYLIKFKRFTDSEAVVLNLYERMHNANEATTDAFGHTKRSSHTANQIPNGTLGGLSVRDTKSGIEFDIGTGLDDALRSTIWNNKAAYIGKIIKYKSQKSGAKDKPRFPTFVGFRDERDM
jgi:DNA ligase-1